MRELLLTVDAGELALWEAEYRLQPWGPEREDYRAGVVAHASEAAMGGQDARSPDDFFPHLKPTVAESELTAEEQQHMARRMLGG